jgi:predicted HTH transcriptional regulator
MLIGRAEKAGSGVDKIMTGWQASHWRRPFLEIENQPDRVKLTLPMFSVIPDQVLDELNTIYDDVSSLNPDELTALSFCQIEGSISNQRLQYVLNMHSADITTLLKKLCLENYLESDNNGRWTTYKLKQKVDTSDQKVASSNQKVDTSGKKVATSEKTIENQYLKELKTLASSEKKVATSGEKVATSGKKVATSNTKVDTSNQKVDTLQHELKEIYGKNIKREDLEVVILKLCESRYVKKEELASLLGKSENYIRNRILPDLLKNGKLEKRFPFTHNHPEQGYKTSEEHAKKL